jgi:hypothetical protein
VAAGVPVVLVEVTEAEGVMVGALTTPLEAGGHKVGEVWPRWVVMGEEDSIKVAKRRDKYNNMIH